MNSAYNPNALDAVRHFFSRRSVFPRLILINIVIFVVGYLIHLGMWLFKIETANGLSLPAIWLAVPSSLVNLAIKPWTVFTYMFFHEGFFHLLFNMMVFYFGGSIFLRYLNERQLLWTYILGGLAGAAFYIAAFNFFPVFLAANPSAIALGASASVLSVMIAIASFVPQYTVQLMFIGPIRLKYLAIFFILMDIFSIQGENPGGHIAHLGGAAWGIIYGFSLRKGTDLVAITAFFSKRKRMKVTRNAGNGSKFASSRPLTDDDYNKQKNQEQQQIDKILDKISRSGYESLSDKEKAILFKNSRK